MSIQGHFKQNEPRFYGVDEPELQGLIKRVLRPGDWAIDGGANCGMFTIPMARTVGPTGRVLAFEPGENNIELLKANCRAAGCDNVDIVTMPLWNDHSCVKFYMCEDGSKNSLSNDHGYKAAIELPTTKLDAYVGTNNFRLIKLDIEGAEEIALTGARLALHDCPYVVAEANSLALPKFGSSIESLCNFMRGRCYDAFILHPTDRLPTYVPPGVEIIPYNSAANAIKLNFNLLFTTFDGLKEAWPKAVCG